MSENEKKEDSSKKYPNKNKLYGKFEKSVIRRRNLQNLAFAKALDLPIDDDDVEIDNRRYNISTAANGVNPLWLFVFLLLLIVCVFLAFSYGMMFSSSEAPSTSTKTTIEVDERQLILRDPDGNIVELPRWKSGVKESGTSTK